LGYLNSTPTAVTVAAGAAGAAKRH